MKIKFLAALFLLVLQVAHGQHEHKAVHGMLVFGKEKIYLSHLPMFHHPHDYQIILEASFPEQVKGIYKRSKDFTPNLIHTLVPEPFGLKNLPSAFKADLYLGHFERGGRPIATKVQVKVEKVLFYKKFDPFGTKPERGAYLLLGNAKEQFLIHEIFSAPDFDQVLEVSAPIRQELAKVRLFTTNQEPLPDSGLLTAETEADEIEVEIKKSFYLETGELSH